MGLSRRSLLAGTGGLAGLAAIGRDASGKSPVSGTSVDVVVIGAGLSGLIAARELVKNGKTVALLEAKSIVGGRMVNKKVAGDGVIDLGGQWGGKTHYLFRSLFDELNLKRYPSYYDGKGVFVWNGTPHTTGLFDDIEHAIGFSNPDDIDLPEKEKEACVYSYI